MHYLDDVPKSEPHHLTKQALSSKANQLLKAKKPRRAKKRKKPRDQAWLKKVEEAKAMERLVKKNYARHVAEFKRLIDTD